MSIESGLVKTVVNIEDGKHRLTEVFINPSATKHIFLRFSSSFYCGKTKLYDWTFICHVYTMIYFVYESTAHTDLSILPGLKTVGTCG